ncbi:MAG TPA: VOC family protein [Allosphingosinicella sp.]|jgi:catechol 2,3-dioxygenase-like lactoylglutathione lyase family enzyme
MIRLAAIDHVVFRVADIDASIRFYTEVLGAAVEKVQAGIGLYQLRAGTSLIDLVPLEGALGRMGGAGPGGEGRNVDHVCFRVADWDEAAVVAHLESHGIAAEVAQRYGAEGDGPSIYLRDPDGNGLELKGRPGPPAGR